MSYKKPAIPAISMLPPALAQLIGPIKENIELMNGTRGAVKLDKLSDTASTAQIIATVNALIARLNATGT